MNYADLETSTDDYASRFAGIAGQWMLSIQSRIICELINSQAPTATTLLDVGGGHGQVVNAVRSRIQNKQLRVEVIGSTPDANVQIREDIKNGTCTYKAGDLLKLPYDDRSFDIVTCFRLVPHCPEWRILISELCRVSKQAVILDYPTAQSINALTPLFFAWKKKLEGNTRTYDLFSHSQIARALIDCSYPKIIRKGEFFWPMVLHRKLKSPALSAVLEMPFALTRLSDYFGSPVIVCAKRV